MPLVLSDARFDTIIEFLRMQHGGATLLQIGSRLTPAVPRRSLHRLLTQLVEVGALTTTGATTYRRYHLRTKPGALGSVLWFAPDSEVGQQAAASVAAQPARSPRPRPARRTSSPVDPSNGGSVNRPPFSAVSPPSADLPQTPPPHRSASSVASAPSSVVGSPPSAVRPLSSGSPSSDSPTVPAKYAQLFATSVSQIIGYRNDRSRAQLALESDAAIKGLTRPEMDAYIPAAIAQLDTLTAEQAARCGVTAAQFAAWRAAWLGQAQQ